MMSDNGNSTLPTCAGVKISNMIFMLGLDGTWAMEFESDPLQGAGNAKWARACARLLFWAAQIFGSWLV